MPNIEYFSKNNLMTPKFRGDSASVFANLVGNWEFRRTITDIGLVEGQASFVPTDPATLHYREDGLLCMQSGFTSKTSKEYFYRLTEDRIQITFAGASPDNSTFLILHPYQDSSGLWAKDVHCCGSDEYRCIYKFESPNRFTVHIEVEGKNKKYSMTTTYIQAHQ